jgi:HSP20 family protein
MSTYMSPDVFDRQIDRMFDEVLRGLETGGQNWVPASNVWEDENGFYVQVALPGWEPKEISLEVKEKMLTVKGERAAEELRQYHLQEIAAGNFARLFTLPASVDHENARAVHANGLLTISFLKREEARILIEAA